MCTNTVADRKLPNFDLYVFPHLLGMIKGLCMFCTPFEKKKTS